MKQSASPALIEFLLNNATFGRAYLITITLQNGQVLNVVDGTNQDITYNGTTYYCSQFGNWSRSAFSNSASFQIEAQSWQLTALIQGANGSSPVYFPGTTTLMLGVINTGIMNMSTVTIKTLYWPLVGMSGTYGGVTVSYNAANPPAGGFALGTMALTTGIIGRVKPAGRSKIVFDVYDGIYLCNKSVPPRMIMSSCEHILFDYSCGLSVANYRSQNIALAAGSNTLYLNLNIPGRAVATYVPGDLIISGSVIYMCTVGGTTSGGSPTFNPTLAALTTDGPVTWRSMANSYALGYVIFTGGQNAGIKAAIKMQTWQAGIAVMQLQLNGYLAFPVATGDTLQLVPGCDKSTGLTGCGGYNNLIHIDAKPYVPNPEVAFA